MFRKRIKNQATKVDKIVTGLIIGGAVAGAIGASRTKTGKKIITKTKDSAKNAIDSGTSRFGRFLVGVIKLFKRKK